MRRPVVPLDAKQRGVEESRRASGERQGAARSKTPSNLQIESVWFGRQGGLISF